VSRDNDSWMVVCHFLQYVRSLRGRETVKNLKFSLKETATSYMRCWGLQTDLKSTKPLINQGHI